MERGSLINKKISKNWNKNLDKFKLEKSLGWEIAIIKKINKFEANIETENNIKGKIKFENLNWTRKNIDELLKVGDLVYVKKINQEDYELKLSLIHI